MDKNCKNQDTIKFSTETNNLSLSFNGDKTKVILKIDGVITDELIVKTERKCLFSWDEIPGSDNRRLIEFLKKNFGIDWVKTTKIEKTKLITKIENGRTVEFIAETENGELNIYEKNTRKMIYKEDKKGSNYPIGEEIKKWEYFQKIRDRPFAKKLDTLHKNRFLRDYSYRVLKEANEVRNKIHDQSFGYALFSEQDLILFHQASFITNNIMEAIKYEKGKEISPVLESISNNLKNKAEEHAKQCLLKPN